MERFDVAIIGGGPGGMRAARLLAENKKKVALINTELGGECLNWGCIPTKVLLHAEELMMHAAHAEKIDFKKILERKATVVRTLKTQAEQFLTQIGVALMPGHGVLRSLDTIDIQNTDGSTKTISAENIILATGSHPRLPSGIKRSERYIISNDVFLLEEIPKTIAIIGGGAVGVEFASVFSAFGSTVEIYEAGAHLLPQEDSDLGLHLQKSFAKRGIEVITNRAISSFDELSHEKILIAIGRIPAFNKETLDALGIQSDERGIATNEYMQTSVPHIYAIGDVAGRSLLAYSAEREGEIAVTHLLGEKPEPLDYNTVPSTIFCHPEIASVGLTLKKAKKNTAATAGAVAAAAKSFYLPNGKAQIMDVADGFCKVVFDSTSGKILGVHIIGERATEMIYGPALAISNGLTVDEMLKTVVPHPVLTEVFQDALRNAKKMM